VPVVATVYRSDRTTARGRYGNDSHPSLCYGSAYLATARTERGMPPVGADGQQSV